MREMQFNRQKAEQPIHLKLLENDKLNEMLRLLQELERAQLRVQQLESQNQEFSNLLFGAKLQEKQAPRPDRLRSAATQTEHAERPSAILTGFGGAVSSGAGGGGKSPLAQQSAVDISPMRSALDVSFETDKNINQEYLKNVMLKYFVYQESKNFRQASLLMSAIMTIMRMTREERNKVEEAREKGSTWNNAKSWLLWTKYDEVEFPKTGSGGTH